MRKKKFTKPNIENLIDSVLKNIDAVKRGDRVDLAYLSSFQVGMSLAKSLAPLLPSEDHKFGFVSGLQSHFVFNIDIDKVETSDKDPPKKKSDSEDGNDLPF